MVSHVERLAAEVLDLPVSERAALAHRLIVSLDETSDAEADAGHVEALRRLDEIERGVIAPISQDELFRRVQKRLAR